ncbi:uncharacterized peroxidase-related enzyme [Pseudarcicella hirudinis]|uniref:Uncharacterized peroxidase-related enzyme n=1 Tax=Pseudarcicella hirudinis TaxID=1079859 RepID=A0A1I5MD74_9BACT|nr:peroxidase-related enzyme [Pseudarcicella hirudinis]SFP07544.1 uncharacterized peroxidase-related enzyme [Pseudarcicella hirudinis]
MAYITLPEEDLLPGIRGLMAFSPETSKPLNALAQVLLHDTDNTLSPGEREMIATFVSSENDCMFCKSVHGAATRCYLEDDGTIVNQVMYNFQEAAISDKMKALLSIAQSVQKGGKHVKTGQIEKAREEGATDKEIHDTVLIAAAFCMFNRYVDGLGTWAPDNPAAYLPRGIKIKEEGYANYDPMKTIVR